MKRFLFLGFSLLLFSTLVTADTQARYRIDLRDGSRLFASDPPVHRGTLVLFHRYPEDVLTSVPEEQVASIRPGTVETSGPAQGPVVARMLEPGEVIEIGETGGGGSPAATEPPDQSGAAISGGVYDPRNPIYGGYAFVPTSPNGQPLPFAARAQSGQVPTANNLVGPNGFPLEPGSTPMMGQNGTPVLAPPGTPGVTAPAIGPDGMPILAPVGTPGSTPPSIGSNGTPVLAPSGSPGAAPMNIGPNGTPVLAPPGSPGSVPPVIGPNGTPILAPGASPAPSVGPNGFPVPATSSPHR